MAYFPFFIDLEQKEGLIVGGGRVALGKARRLLPYGPRLTVAAPQIFPDFYELEGIALLEEPFVPEILDGKCFVIAATGDVPLDRRIARLCRERDILVNVVGDREACTFLFPALVKRGDLSIGISTGGPTPVWPPISEGRSRRCCPGRRRRYWAFCRPSGRGSRGPLPKKGAGQSCSRPFWRPAWLRAAPFLKPRRMRCWPP